MGRVIDALIAYRLLKLLVTPFNKTKAYQMGIIYAKGKVIIKKKQFDTFYSEHLRTYSLNSFLFIAKNLNMNVEFVEFPSRYGGNIRVFLNKKDNLLSTKRNEYYLRKEKDFKKDKRSNLSSHEWGSM